MSPPNKWYGFSTSGMTSTEFLTVLNNAYTNGYTGQTLAVPVPGATDNSYWVAIAGYGSTTED
jgi:hypothetical protein